MNNIDWIDFAIILIIINFLSNVCKKRFFQYIFRMKNNSTKFLYWIYIYRKIIIKKFIGNVFYLLVFLCLLPIKTSFSQQTSRNNPVDQLKTQLLGRWHSEDNCKNPQAIKSGIFFWADTDWAKNRSIINVLLSKEGKILYKSGKIGITQVDGTNDTYQFEMIFLDVEKNENYKSISVRQFQSDSSYRILSQVSRGNIVIKDGLEVDGGSKTEVLIRCENEEQLARKSGYIYFINIKSWENGKNTRKKIQPEIDQLSSILKSKFKLIASTRIHLDDNGIDLIAGPFLKASESHDVSEKINGP